MATEILVNDGGAPARILPFVAGAVIEAGQCVKVAADGQVELASDKDLPIAGVALTAAAAIGDMVNIITGSGVILNIKCEADVNRGDALMTKEAADGELELWVKTDDSIAVACALEDAGVAAGEAAGTRGLTKCLVF